MQKVLMLGNHQSVKGGITTVVKQLLEHNWTADDIDMHYIATYKGGGTFFKLVYFLVAYIEIWLFIKVQKPDIVHVHMSHHGSFDRANAVKKLCKKNKIPIVVHLHGSEFKSYYEEVSESKRNNIERFFTECTSVIVLGKEWKDFILKIAPRSNPIILNNTVKIPTEVVAQDVNRVSFLFMGVLYERKGVMDLLEAVKNIRDMGLLRDGKVFFNIAGTGPEEVKLKQFVKDEALDHFVSFCGWVSGEEKEACFKRNQVFVLPSYNEGLPMSILEALSYGMPVISTCVGSINEAVVDSENGFLYKPGDTLQLTRILSHVIRNPEIRMEMAENARITAETKFNDNYYFKAIKRIYLNEKDM